MRPHAIPYRATALFLSLLGATAATHAQTASAGSSVQLYGLVDACVTRADLGAATYKALNSGCLYGSRWGFRGSEDMGGGLRAGFVLEGGFNIDSGQLGQGNRIFGRKALLNLSTPWGGIEAGRDYAPAFYVVQPIDPMALGIGTASSTIWTGASSTTVARNDNAVNLLSPAWGDWSARLQVGAGEGGTGTARKTMGFNLMHRSARTIAAIAHTRAANAADTADDSATTLGVRHDFGAFSLAAIAQSGSWKGSRTVAAPSNAASIYSRDYRSYLVGGSVRVGAVGTVNTSLKRYDDRTAPNFDATQFSVNYVHALSKRTDLYAGYSRLKNERGSRYEVSDATTAYTNVTPGAATSLLAVGIKHLF